MPLKLSTIWLPVLLFGCHLMAESECYFSFFLYTIWPHKLMYFSSAMFSFHLDRCL